MKKPSDTFSCIADTWLSKNNQIQEHRRLKQIVFDCIRGQVNKIPAQKKANNIPTMLLLPVSVLVWDDGRILSTRYIKI